MSIIEKARELGTLIVESPEYIRMQAAEEAAMADSVAATAVSAYLELQQEMQSMMESPNPDREALNEKTHALQNANAQIQAYDSVREMTAARQGFEGLMGQVNAVLRFVITGETEPEDSACSGSCAGCAGCSAQ